MLSDLLFLHDRLEPERQLSLFRTIEQATRRRQEWIEEYHARLERAREEERQRQEEQVELLRKQKKPKEQLPPPPLPETETIVPLIRASHLSEEGRMQHNCVGSYAWRVLCKRRSKSAAGSWV
jgi:hypothetical protein